MLPYSSFAHAAQPLVSLVGKTRILPEFQFAYSPLHNLLYCTRRHLTLSPQYLFAMSTRSSPQPCLHDTSQFAGRASTDLHAHVYFRGRVATEEAYVMRLRRNGIVVLVIKVHRACARGYDSVGGRVGERGEGVAVGAWALRACKPQLCLYAGAIARFFHDWLLGAGSTGWRLLFSCRDAASSVPGYSTMLACASNPPPALSGLLQRAGACGCWTRCWSGYLWRLTELTGRRCVHPNTREQS